MADRRTRFGKGLKNVTLYGSCTLDSSATLTNSGTISSAGKIGGVTAASLDALAHGVASGDTTYAGLKVACGQLRVTGSKDVNTGLTTVISGGANIGNTTGGVSTTPQTVQIRIPRSVAPVSKSKGSGYMKIVVKGTSASVESSGVAASVDWFAIGT